MSKTVDHEALKQKYQTERHKRLRKEGNDQYIEPKGRYAHFLEDPYVEVKQRAPLTQEIEVAIIGAGFAGLLAGARLKEAKINDVWLIEEGGDVGGVWYWNRYPGAMCDSASMIYLPLLEETGYMPSLRYAMGPEIWTHAKRIAAQFELDKNALFSTDVSKLTWDETAARWLIETSRGDKLKARYVITGTGPLNRPKLPGIAGIEDFEGHAFHTSRWDYNYTGGDSKGASLEKLSDKRVGIIGTGATAVQCIPHLGRSAQQLYVFQRTPSTIDVRKNGPIDASWYENLEPGWQEKWLLNFAAIMEGAFTDENLVNDQFTDLSIRIRDCVAQYITQGEELSPQLIRKAFEESDDEKMEEIRARVDAIVEDPKTAEGLKPWYRLLCKRPCFHDEYLQTYNLPNVELVHTDGKGVERIDKSGVWANAKHYKLDCLIFASGFEVGKPVEKRNGFQIVGRNQKSLSEYWSDGCRTLHGMHAHGFPNLFVVDLRQAAFHFTNITHNFSDSARTIAAILKHAYAIDAQEIETTQEAENAWVKQIEKGRMTNLNNLDCTPGYYNNEGQPLKSYQKRDGGYPQGIVAFFNYIKHWRESGNFAGLSFKKRS